MVRPGAGNERAHIAGDGNYAIEVISELRHQDRIEWLVQGRGEEPADHACTALLVHEPDHPYDADAVSVSINGMRIGYLPEDAAASMIAAMRSWGFDRATCEAVIEGGWYRSADDKGDFSVRLDANPDFTPAVFPVAHRPPALPAPVAAVARARNTARDLVLGATATVAMLVLTGVVWLFVQRPAESVARDHSALAPASMIIAHEPAVAAVSSVVVPELRPAPDNKVWIATAARAAAKEIDPPIVAAVPPPGLASLPQLAVHPSLPPVSAPGTEWVDLTPPPRPGPEIAESDPPNAKAAPDVRRSRARARSRAGLIAARARARSRNRARHKRSGRRAVQYRRASKPVRTNPQTGAPPIPPAASLFDAWTKEVTGVMGQRP